MFSELTTWMAMVEVPLFATLFRLLAKTKKDIDGELLLLKDNHGQHHAAVREALAEFKLHVAKNYVPVTYLKDVETRLTDHLLRIEKKLDETGRGR